MSKRYDNLRINIFLICVLLLSSLVLYRLFILSIIRHSGYSRTAEAQSESISNILARGNIYFSDKDSNLTLAATNKKFPLAYVVPSDIKSEKRLEAVEKVSEILKIDRGLLDEKINSGSGSLRVIARKISNEQVEAIKSL